MSFSSSTPEWSLLVVQARHHAHTHNHNHMRTRSTEAKGTRTEGAPQQHQAAPSSSQQQAASKQLPTDQAYERAAGT
jgi:hypothetical protein